MNAATVYLTERQVAEAVSLALARRTEFARRGGHYGHNSEGSQFTGALGEIAALEWLHLRMTSVKGHFRFSSQSTEPDISADGIRVEVKSWRARGWQEFGRSISISQLTAISRHAHVVLCCRVPSEPEVPSSVELIGWASVNSFIVDGEPGFVGARAQLQLPENALLPPLDLLASAHRNWLAVEDLRAISACIEGHSRFAGRCWTCLAPDELKWVIVSETENARVFHDGVWDQFKRAHAGAPVSANWRIRPIGDFIDLRKPCRRCFPR